MLAPHRIQSDRSVLFVDLLYTANRSVVAVCSVETVLVWISYAVRQMALYWHGLVTGSSCDCHVNAFKNYRQVF